MTITAWLRARAHPSSMCAAPAALLMRIWPESTQRAHAARSLRLAVEHFKRATEVQNSSCGCKPTHGTRRYLNWCASDCCMQVRGA